MGKSLCKLKKDQIRADLDKVLDMVTDPRYVCRNCARVANKSQWLCEPLALPESDQPTRKRKSDSQGKVKAKEKTKDKKKGKAKKKKEKKKK